MREAIVIGDKSFRSQKQANQYCSEILNQYKPDDRLSDEHSLFLAALLERHPEYVEKLGCGLDHFEVMKNDYGTQSFRIVRVDCTGTGFSYGTSVRGKPNPKKSDVLKALRWVIQREMFQKRETLFQTYADETGRIPCAVTKRPILRDEGHMDHRAPMTLEVIVRTFLAHHGLSYDDVALTFPGDDQKVRCTDPDLTKAFRKYHHEVATVDFVTKHENLSQASKNRIKKAR